jgi:hypothetical protein
MIVRYFICLACLGGLIFFVQPFTMHQLSVVCYIPDGWFDYLVVIYWCLMYFTFFSAIGTDGLFCALATCIIVQFKLLGQKCKLLDIRTEDQKERQIWNKIKELVDYHNFLIKYFESFNMTRNELKFVCSSYCVKFNKIFSGLFLVQFLITITSVAVAAFTLTQPYVFGTRSQNYQFQNVLGVHG